MWFEGDRTDLSDAFGLPPELYGIITEAAATRASLYAASQIIQYSLTDLGRDYCVSFCLAPARNVQFDDLVSYWTSRSDKDETFREMVAECLQQLRRTRL